MSTLDDPYDPRHEVPLEDGPHDVPAERILLASKFIQEIAQVWIDTPADDVSPWQRGRLVEAMELIERARDLVVTDPDDEPGGTSAID